MVAPTPRRGTWSVALGATLLVAIFPQFAIGALGPQLRAELALSPADVGLVFSGFLLAGLVGSPLAGPVVDRVGGRRACLVLLLVAAAALAWASWATSMLGLVAALLPAGAAMAFANPGTNRWAQAAPDARSQALLVGVAQAGVQAGALLAGGLAAAAALGLDWRGALRVGAVLALLGAAAVWRAPGDHPARRDRGTDAAALPAARGRLGPTQRRDLLVLAAYAALMGGGTAIIFAYLPSHAVDTAGLTVAAAGATTMVFGGTALVCRLALGAVVRSADQVGPRLLVGMALGSAVAVVAVAAAALHPAWVWVGAVLFGATGTTWPAVAFLAVVRASPPGAVGLVTGWVTAAFYLGLWLTPPLAGRLVEDAGYPLLWAASIACYLLAVVPARRAPTG